jgi:phenylalanyl-tRNA synthetase beta chain
MEDVAIAYGYNNLEITPPNTLTYGGQQPLNMLSDLLRYELAYAGYTEVLSFALVCFDSNLLVAQSIKVNNPMVVSSSPF